MKATLFSAQGEKKGNVELPKLFDSEVREDIVQKYFLVSQEKQPYGPSPEAGRHHSAAGTISHKRHDWKGHYGRGISRVARKTMWRRGTQFFWVGAEAASTRGGRRVHGPAEKAPRDLNKKEKVLAMNSGFAATANTNYIVSRYETLKSVDNVPAVIESLPEKTKDLLKMVKNIFGESSSLAIKSKSVRSGKGKRRGRKYKSNAGVLIVTGSDEKSSFKGLDVRPVSEVSILDLFPLGRLTLYTSKALEELGGKK